MRNVIWNSVTRAGALGGIAMLAALPVVARADDPPAYASGPPSYATGGQTETIKGTIYSMSGRYAVVLEDERGFEDSITLHDGTVITPVGLSLGAGQVATITGHTDGKTFAADEVDVDPETISNGQALLPASDYLVAGGSQYPGYAFGYNATAYGLSGFVGPYGSSYYNGGYGNYYGGYYGGGGYSYQHPTVAAPSGGNGTNPIARRPVSTQPVNGAPGFRYPTGARGVGPIVRQPTSYGTSRGPAPQYRSAPQVHAAPPASSSSARSH